MSGGRSGRSNGGRGGAGRELPRTVQVSKSLSKLLRHDAEKENISLGPGGYANLQDVLNNRKIRSLKVTFDEVRSAVEESDKQRFTMVLASSLSEPAPSEASEGQGVTEQTTSPSQDPKDYLIRANQGHSVKVDAEGLLTPITPENLPAMAVHGTTHAAWPLIAASGGLKPMTRNHIHFASGLPSGFSSIVEDAPAEATRAAPVISGMRNSSTVLIYLDVAKTMEAGIKLWLSDNGVILSGGNADGIMPLEVFKRVEDRTGQGVLVEDGKVIKEAPASWSVKRNAKRPNGKTAVDAEQS